MLRAFAADAPGEWLPKALSDLLIAFLSIWGECKVKRSEVLESWGLSAEDMRRAEDDERNRNLEAAFDALEGKMNGKGRDTDRN